MTRYTKTEDGSYKINDKTYKMLSGSRAQVWHDTAYKTSGGLTKKNLVFLNGRVKSKAKHISAKKENRLVKYGYVTKKGAFGNVKVNKKPASKKSKKGKKNKSKKSKRSKGGSTHYKLNPEAIKQN